MYNHAYATEYKIYSMLLSSNWHWLEMEDTKLKKNITHSKINDKE